MIAPVGAWLKKFNNNRHNIPTIYINIQNYQELRLVAPIFLSLTESHFGEFIANRARIIRMPL